MSELHFNIERWLGTSLEDPLERETLAALKITAGPGNIVVTEVQDTLAHTLRDHINVPAYFVARWLLVNWWRLRWEPYRGQTSLDWLHSHSMAAIGGDYAWPELTFSSDGEFIQLRLQPETSADVSALRYISNVSIDIPAPHFEQAVERFLDDVEARVSLRLSDEHELSELRDELRQELGSKPLRTAAKYQAIAGLDPGAASDEWVRGAEALGAEAGVAAAEDMLAAAPSFQDGLEEANRVIAAMRESATRVDLRWAATKTRPLLPCERPWEQGARLATELRTQIDIAPGPLSRTKLEDLLGTKLPLKKSPWLGKSHLRGGYRNSVTNGRTALLVTNERNDSQRFYLARVIAATLRASDDQHVLPVSDAATALQKFERSFAQEFLCPWEALDAFTDESGTGDDGIADAAAHFEVSEQLVLSTLVNKGKIPRSRLMA